MIEDVYSVSKRDVECCHDDPRGSSRTPGTLVHSCCPSCAQKEIDKLMEVSLNESNLNLKGRTVHIRTSGDGSDGCVTGRCCRSLEALPLGGEDTCCDGVAGVAVVDKLLVPLPYWLADRSWCMKVMRLVYQSVKLQTLMAWCNTLGGAHSALGEDQIYHAASAGNVSMKQLTLSTAMGDPVLACRSRIFLASSLLQLGHLKAAKKIIKKEYHFATTTAVGRSDAKLAVMCQSAMCRYRLFRQQEQRIAD